MPRPPAVDATATGFFVLRTPLLSFAELWCADLPVHAPDAVRRGAPLQEALDHDRQLSRRRLADLVQNEVIRSALLVASPDLDDVLHRSVEEPASRRGQRVERALVRYVTRMATRCTPFGLFAGYSVGTISDGIALELPARRTATRSTRLDWGYLCSLVDAVAKDPALRQQLRFRPDPTIYRAAGRLHHVEQVVVDGQLVRQLLRSTRAAR